MAHSNVRQMLTKAVSDAHPGEYAYYHDHMGDGESGDCVYGVGGEMRCAPYEMANVGGKVTANLDKSEAKRVMPMTDYREIADDDDNYSSMSEAMVAAGLYAKDGIPLSERFISKKERDSADEGDFAGKGKSFPILKPGDVQAAVHAMGRAGSSNLGMAALKARIIAIAKKKGWTSELPKNWQDGEADAAAKEAAKNSGMNGGPLKLVESTTWKDDTLSLIEAAGGAQEMELKLIAPGKGSSAFYPKEVLQRDGPKVFTKNTQIYINHATAAEESQRPEGDWHKLAGALSTDAEWKESHPKGPGLYAMAKFTSDYAPLVKEKAAFSGMSIRANGTAAQESGRTQMKEGVPVLASLTSAESVDVVTRAGAGGLILTESAIKPNEGDEMSDDEKKRLFEAARIVEEGRARVVATSALSDLSLLEAGKNKVIDSVIRLGLPRKNGMLDEAALVETVKAEAKREGEYLASLFGGGRVTGMGGAAPVQLTEKELKKQRQAGERKVQESASIFTDLTGDPRAGAFAAQGRAA